MSMVADTGQVGLYASDELVVALPYAPIIGTKLSALGGRGLSFRVTERSRALDLALVRVHGIEKAADELRRLVDEQARAVHGRDHPELPRVPGPHASDLDRLMFHLRCTFIREWAGWVPPMGKNRHVESVTGLPHLSGGGVHSPVPCGEPSARTDRDHRLGAGVRVGVLDTRLHPHRALAGRYIVADEDSILRAEEPFPHFAGHATFVAGLVLRSAPAAELDVRWVLDDRHAVATTWQAACRMVEFRDAGVAVLNMSLGCSTNDGVPPLVISRAVELLTPDVVLVAAAGNHGEATTEPPGHRLTPRTPMWPAALPDVVAVGAYNHRSQQPACFSPKVPWLTFTAPGENVDSTYLTGKVLIENSDQRINQVTDRGPLTKTFDGYATWSGTSFAAATVSGHIAARTVPGRRDAREALRQLKDRAQREADGEVRVHRPEDS
ncbi:MAG TPA: S8/S53 family peptidase [Micromonosporaceae bacterium]|nr:S8/S53 family peptidase [Micromonosporaceae bacterium]